MLSRPRRQKNHHFATDQCCYLAIFLSTCPSHDTTMEGTPQEHSASFERLKGILDESASVPSGQKEKPDNALPRRRRLASEDTQPVEGTDEEESDDAIVPARSRGSRSSPATSLLTAALDLEDTQLADSYRPGFGGIVRDSQLAHTLLTNDNTDTAPHIHLDYSPDKLTHPQYGDDETQKDPDSYNDRMKDNVTSMVDLSKRTTTEDSDGDGMSYSQSQPEPVYFDERKRFGDVGLLVKEKGDGSDDEEVLRPVMQDSLPIGLTQMFEASSPQRPVTRSSLLPTSPHLGLTSPTAARDSLPPPPKSGAVSSRYISVEESQEERERRRKKLSYPEDGDRDFGPRPPELVSRLGNQIREKDSVEQFKEISVARPKPQGPRRRGRPPKNRLEPLLVTSAPTTDRPSSPATTEPVIIEEDESDEEKEDEEESADEAELEVPGTMEPVLTEVKKTQSSQYRSATLKDLNAEEAPGSSEVEAIADSQPETTAKAAAELEYGEDVIGRSLGMRKTRRKLQNVLESSSPAQYSNQDPLSSSPPLRRITRREEMIIKSSPFPPAPGPLEPRSGVEDNEETPRATRSTRQGASKTRLLDALKTPMTAKKIPLPIPTTIPATSPYNRDNLLSNIETPLPMAKRKRAEDQDMSSSVDLLPAQGIKGTPINVSKGGRGSKPSGEIFHKPKRPRLGSTGKSSEANNFIKGLPKDREVSVNDETEEAGIDENGSPMNLSGANSPVDSSSRPNRDGKPNLHLDTTTPRKATIPFQPTSSQRKELLPDTEVTSSQRGESLAAGPLRVFAQWEASFYPAVVNELPAFNESTPTRFQGAEISVRLNRMKKLQLSPGDAVKVNSTRQKVWIVEHVYKSLTGASEPNQTESGPTNQPGGAQTESQAEREEVHDIHGNNMVRLKHKSGETLDTIIGNIVLSAAQFNRLKPQTIDIEHSLHSVENTPLFKKEDSILETPSKLSRRGTPNVAVKPIKFPLSAKSKHSIFSGMRFTISLPADKDGKEKTSITNMLERAGAYILEHGFEGIFESVSESDTTELVPRQGAGEIGFTAVISDRASTTPKYLQALALGLPCLAVKWVVDSVATGMPLPWQDYLLPAGESQYLDGAVKSRVIDWIDINSATFANMFSRRKKLMDAMNVIFHDGSGKRKDGLQTFAFLIHAMGPARVHYTKSVEGVNDLLKTKGSKTHWHFVFSMDENRSRITTKRKGRDLASAVRIVGDEWLKQSLIFGKLLDEDF
ncbi:hypothetical protein AA313_de0209771 [Arthrobotrys entomopaga]|nr:hypothetical protein AA313_de0209771 [Arthrobotrys entomopaga]